MKLIDFQTNDAFTIRGLQCKRNGIDEIIASEGRIELRGENRYRLVTGKGIYDFSVVDTQDERHLADRMKQWPYNLAYVSNTMRGTEHDTNTFFLHIVFFFRADRKPAFNIVLSNRVKDTLIQKRLVMEKSLENDVLQNFVLTDGTNTCYALTIGKYRFDAQDDTENDAVSAEIPGAEDDNDSRELDVYRSFGNPAPDQKSIVLYGKDYSLRIKLADENDGSFFYAETIDTRMRKVPPMAIFLGTLSFKDGEQFVAENIKRELELTQGYLDIWDRYTSIEGDFLLEKARKIGLIQFDRKNVSYIDGGFVVYPKGIADEQRKLLSTGDVLQLSEEIPVYLNNEDMTWQEYKNWLSDSASGKTGSSEKSAMLTIQRIDRDGSWILTAKENRTFPAGNATLSLWGDMLQIMRREDARERIANCASSNPALGLLIEGKKPDTVLDVKKQTPIEPLSALVKEKLFAQREPRERQKEAIRIALNTPDIALIQGPPGTGKTTVITAIVERLNELTDKRQNNQGQVLLTSFQHDAVRNVIERLQINSLPTPKYGRQGEEDISHEHAIETWRMAFAKRLKERNPEVQQTTEQQELFLRHNAYLTSPSEANALRFLELARKVNVDDAIAAEIDRLIAETNAKEDETANRLLEKVRRLRITEAGFMDDGPEMADTVLADLEAILNYSRSDHKKILDTLEEAADFSGDTIDVELLKRLSEVRADLISRCSPKPTYSNPQPDPDILAVFDELQRTLRKPHNELGEILYNLLNELENNSENAESVIKGYSFAYAATAQQSEGRDIKSAKKAGRSEHPEYDTVIIDEAARVNPGDLMIPMSQAKRRIILVGDHRQLPHIYDEEIFESMRDDGSEISKDVVTKSMFEYIKEKLEDLEKIDHIPRTITLDAQYRMHPVLGNFVNDNFYKIHGEGFESPLGEDRFKQGLVPQPYLWIDVPNRLGNEQRKGTSRQRECEADCIVKSIEAYMKSPEGENLTYGIITFYSAQKDLIRNKLRGAGLLDKVRVGSVDAFQGMEFDVIFLSVVRTHNGKADFNEELLTKDVSMLDKNGEEYTAWVDYKEEIGMRNYGFLTSENRLCVALSRQKRLLIVVGDAAIFHEGSWGVLAENCVPALRNFYELCRKGGMVLHGYA